MIEGAYPKMIVSDIAVEINKDISQYIVKQLVSLDIDPNVLTKQAMEIQRLNSELDKMYQKGREDAIEEYTNKLRKRIERNKIIAERFADNDKFEELALTNLDLEEIEMIAEHMKEGKNETCNM